MALQKGIVFQHAFRLRFNQVNTFALSQKGSARDMNQDRFIVDMAGQDKLIAAIADGMGGEAGGNIAAQMAVTGIKTFFHPDKPPDAALKAAVTAVDRKLFDYAASTSGFKKMGTTLTALVLHDDNACWAHIGDTRLYLLRDCDLIQITTDQTLVEKLFAKGEISKEQKKNHYLQHVLSQCVGRGQCIPETGSADLKPGDLLLLSSDGIHKFLDRSAMELVFNSNDTLEDKALALLQESQKNFGSDDATVLLIEWH